MIGKITKTSQVSFTWNAFREKLYSPDGKQHLLPCERCGTPQWASPASAAVLCPNCAMDLREDLGEWGAAVAAGEISETDAIMTVCGKLHPRPWE